MIDYIALTLGHGLLAIALWRLFMRDAVDSDPLLTRIRSQERANRSAIRNAGRSELMEETGQAAQPQSDEAPR